MRIRIIAPILLVAVLAGCTPAPTVPTAAPTTPVVETPSATPTPQPTQEPETGLVQPAQVFDGDCANLLTNADASTALGAPVKRGTRDLPGDVRAAIVMQAGGLTCGWNDTDFAFGITVTAAPAESVAGLEAPLVCGTGYVEFAPDLACGVESTSNGMVVSGLAWFGDGASSAAKKKATAAVTALTERIAANSTLEMFAPTPIPADAAWANPGPAGESNPPSCVDLDAAVTSDAFMGGSPRAEPYEGGGGDVYLTPIERDLLGYATGEPWDCAWYVERTKAETKKGLLTTFDVTPLGGGAWFLDQVLADAPNAEEISVEGVDRAYRVTSDYGSMKIWVTSGPNLAVGGYEAGTKDAGYISLALVVEALNAQ